MLLAALFFLPESPKFLLAGGREKEARQALAVFQPNAAIVEESMRDIRGELALQLETPAFSVIFKNKETRAGFLAGIFVCSIVPFTGILAIDFFATELMIHEGGFSPDQAAMFNLPITFSRSDSSFPLLCVIDWFSAS